MPSLAPIRLLTAVPICDGHDSAINTINLELIRHGFEVIYLGYHRSAQDIVRAAIQEDVWAIGISSYNGGHVEFFTEVVHLLRRHDAGDIGVFGGGGGTITRTDAAAMHRKGVDRIFFAGTPLAEMIAFIQSAYAQPAKRRAARNTNFDRQLAMRLSHLISTSATPRLAAAQRAGRPPKLNARPLTLGITGPGGAGKTTLIDELVLRCLRANPAARLAILSHDPSIVGRGALLGDRATMIYSQDDRVFMRSLSTRGQSGGLARQSRRCLNALQAESFDVIFIETVGIGQEAAPFDSHQVDKTIYVMSPEYGSRLQLQKIAMLDLADVIVINKSDLAGAKAAQSEVDRRLAANARNQRLIATTASRHGDPGGDELFNILKSSMGTTP
jgi:methylmalonyl-CoA mutase